MTEPVLEAGPPDPLGVALVGAGRFAGFIAEATRDLPGLAWRAVADPDRGRAGALAERLGVEAVEDWRGLLEDPVVSRRSQARSSTTGLGVDALVVAAPPGSHAEIVRAALVSGRHVLCEKPLATTAAEAHELAVLAEKCERTLVVDHVLRYNPLLHALLGLREGLLGPVQRFCFENDAADQDLDPGHWFWDESRSGGIFVEHGVHFFDAAAMLLDRPATHVQASIARRTADAPADLVSATVTHAPDVLATHTHSFTHAHRCERQLMRLDHGTAEVRVEGWIPVLATVDAWTDEAGVAVAERFAADPPAGLSVTADITRDAGIPQARGRGVELTVPHHVRLDLSLGGHDAKQAVYAASVRAAVADLVHCARTGDQPVSNARTAAAAVAVAEAATTAAATGKTLPIDDLGVLTS